MSFYKKFDNLTESWKMGQVSHLSWGVWGSSWLMVALLVTVEHGESSEGQSPGSGTVICYLSKPPMAEGRNGNQI